jgi:hypothetical protein
VGERIGDTVVQQAGALQHMPGQIGHQVIGASPIDFASIESPLYRFTLTAIGPA